MEAYGPSGSAIIIEAITDNRNRTTNDVKNILSDLDAKFALPGSVRWAFTPPSSENMSWQPKFKQELNEEDKEKLIQIIEALEEYDDVQKVSTNT